MPQAHGAQARFSFVPETTWGTTPGSPAMKMLKAAVYGESLGSDIAELISNSINSNRSVEAMRGGNISIKGSVPFELAPLGLGTILKHILGSNVDSGAGPYVHTMKRGTLPAGMTIEKGFVDLAQYLVFTGCKVNSASINIPSNGLVTGSLDVIGKSMSAPSGTSLGTPTATTHTPWAEFEAVTKEGGSAATVLNMSLNITNELDAVEAVGSRYISALMEGKGNTTGEVVMMFDGVATMNKWLNETASSLQVTLTTGANILDILLPNIKYIGDATPKIATSKGIVLPLKFRAIYDSVTELTDVKFTLTNTETTV